MRRDPFAPPRLWPAVLALTGIVIAVSPQIARSDATVGAWGPLQDLPYSPVHSVMLPTSKVLLWPTNHDAQIWDPSDGSITRDVGTPGYNIFCAGHSLIADGRVLVTGGHIAYNAGLNNASYYNPSTDTWKRLADMNAGRWYPTNVTLANGDVVVMSGTKENGSVNLIPQVWQVGIASWRTLSNASLSLPLYPAAFLAPNGKVFVAIAKSRYLDTAGTGAWTAVATRKNSGRDDYGSAAMYDNGKVIYTGGGDPPTATVEVIDLNAAKPAWKSIASMPQKRRQHNVTVLPDGTLLVTGGSSSGEFNTNDGPKPAINWNPVTNAWTTWATESRYRGYHSEAVLLSDGRVASIGGVGDKANRNNPSLQVFSPPYLFKGVRPTLSSAPATVAYGQTFFIGTPDAMNITAVNWIRLSAVTHTKNMNQRINRLPFTQQTVARLKVTAPSSRYLAPPGHYLLFILNGDGVPSVGKMIKIT